MTAPPEPRSDPVAVALFGEIAMVERLSRARISRALPPGMEISHFALLNHLVHAGGERSPAQLARLFHVTRGAMTNTLTRLERAGYIHIRPDWDDGRRKFVTISPAGRAARDQAVRAVAPVFEGLVAAVGAERMKAALPLLRDLRMALEEPG